MPDVKAEVERFTQELVRVLHKVLPSDAAATIMNEDNVGQGCWCIYPFEKHYIKIIFGDAIKEVEDNHQKMRDWKPPPGMTTERALTQKKLNNDTIYAVEHTYLRDLRKVVERFKNMPECKF